ncbi:NAD(P)H-dependent flavin oxidoreductase [Pantoea septica]|uniref:NAD(P)H-dependent flavin oxidoreductase n=1 Tax=Pantoea septica TaxID=472695 RepID=UPI0028A1CF37|nr:nitronate monooxygenase [Pantoea septica]
MDNPLRRALRIAFPLIQAPMAGVSTPELAAAVSNAGALGSISLGASNQEQASAMLSRLRQLTAAPVNVNLFCHAPPQRNAERERAWLERFAPLFAQYGALPPPALSEIYPTFNAASPLLEPLLEAAPAAVSFHFGLPEQSVIERLKKQGMVTLASATSVEEARLVAAAGIDFVVAQGFEAGGHRGIFDPEQADAQMNTRTLVQTIRNACDLPVIAAGGMMDGSDIAAMMKLGAAGAQLGTAFLLCPESAANAAWRAALKSDAARETEMTAAISGRPARCLSNAFCRATRDVSRDAIPDYPLAYSLGKALAAAAAAQGEHGFGAQWAGQGAPRAREMAATELVNTLIAEYRAAQ